jgi:S1-C subfamily serine protease
VKSRQVRKHPKLLGEVSKDQYVAWSADGVIANPNEVVFPILRRDASRKLHLVGTGFFIAENGIFVTAKHNLFQKPGVPYEALMILQFAPGNKYHQRPVHRCVWHPVADVAVGVAWPMHHTKTAQALSNKVLRLSANAPPVEARVATYAYPKTTIVHRSPQVVHTEPAFFEGELIEYLPDGRDRILLPGPCFRTSMVIHGGASGGPVIAPDGRVFGINSTGFDNDFLSYVSPISEILQLGISGVRVPGASDARVVTVRELADHGFVSLA